MEWIFIGIGIYVIYALLRKKDTQKGIVEGDRYYESDESDLEDFRITVSTSFRDEEKTKNKEPGKWIGRGETVQVGGVDIKDGFIYFGGRLRGEDDYGYSTEAALIDSTLKINMSNPDYDGDNMGYWPSYNSIAPTSRAAYIKWLAGSREDTNTYIGYVFLYFYGIERRLLIDDKNGLVSAEERKVLIKEVCRLRNIYDDNRSFGSYSSNFLSYIYFLHPNIAPTKDDWLSFSNHLTIGLQYALGKLVDDGKPISADLALAWVRGHPEIRLRTPARRCEEEFNQLFRILYQEKFGEGFIIKLNKKKLKIEYKPASISLSLQSKSLDLPDVTFLKGPRKKLEEIAEICINALDSYSRFLGKVATEKKKDSLNAIILLPDKLVPYVENKKFLELKTRVKKELNSLISIRSIIEYFDDKTPMNVSKKTAEAVALLLEKMEIGIAPDVRFHSAKPDIDGSIAIFAGGHGAGFSPSIYFRQAEIVLYLGITVATSDNHIDSAEVDVLKAIIMQNSQLSAIEQRSLNSYLHWALNEPVKIAALKSRLSYMNDEQKNKIKKVLIQMVIADGKVKPAEVKQLEKFYVMLGVDKSVVSSDISNALSGSTVGIERTEEVAQQGVRKSIRLDSQTLERYEKDTQDVQKFLQDIFGNDAQEMVETSVDDKQDLAVASPLDDKYSDLYNILITKEKWEREHVKSLCKEQNLMMEGAIERINDWVFNLVSAPVIESTNSIILVDLEVVEEITKLQERV